MSFNRNLMSILSFFCFDGRITNIKEYGNGHINKTFLIETDLNKYIFQVINSYVFGDIEVLMHNIRMVTEHLSRHGDITLTVIPTFTGETYYFDKQYYYRMYSYVENTVCYEKIENLEMARKTGVAFGQLHHQLEGIDTSFIAEVIKDFHNTPRRVENLLVAEKKNNFNRIQECQEELNYIKSQKDKISLITDGLNDGSIPMRITHNDPKINNILFDKDTNEVKCVIDLDTIMPGSALYDFGDALRSLFTGDNEDNEDLSTIKVDLDLYKAYTDGYVSMMKSSLTEREIELLPMSIFIIAIELASRFLEDYLNGDIYFHTSKPNHNLIRCRTQIQVAKEVLKHLDELNKITKEIVGKY